MNKKHGAWSKNEKIFLGLLAPILVLFFCFNTLPLSKVFITDLQTSADMEVMIL